MWQLDKLLRAMHILFHNVPARREDYSTVVERAVAVWPSLQQYMDEVRRKKLPNPGTTSFDTIETVTIYLLIHVLSRHFLFYFESTNFPLVSGTLPFLLCQGSDCLPWFPKCFHLFPLAPRGQIVCVSLCPVPVCCVLSMSLILAFLSTVPQP